MRYVLYRFASFYVCLIGFSSIPEKNQEFSAFLFMYLVFLLLGFDDSLCTHFVVVVCVLFLQMYRSFTISVTLVSYFVTLYN